MRFVLVALLTLVSFPASALFFCDGDSQTMRRPPLTAGQPWCEILTARKGQNTIYNFATSGATSGAFVRPGSPPVAVGTNNVLYRLPQHFALGDGNCLALMIGENDAYENVTNSVTALNPAQTKANLHSIIVQHQTYHHTEITIFLNSPFWSSATLEKFPQYIRAIREEAAADGVPVIDSYTVDNLDRCWLYPAGTPEYAACEAAYIPNEPTYHVGATVNQHIADLCLKPENADACACRTN